MTKLFEHFFVVQQTIVLIKKPYNAKYFSYKPLKKQTVIIINVVFFHKNTKKVMIEHNNVLKPQTYLFNILSKCKSFVIFSKLIKLVNVQNKFSYIRIQFKNINL